MRVSPTSYPYPELFTLIDSNDPIVSISYLHGFGVTYPNGGVNCKVADPANNGVELIVIKLLFSSTPVTIVFGFNIPDPEVTVTKYPSNIPDVEFTDISVSIPSDVNLNEDSPSKVGF